MNKKICYQHVDQNHLADYLASNEISSAEDVASVHIYRCTSNHQESLVIALPDGNAVIISNEPQAAVDRRRNAG